MTKTQEIPKTSGSEIMLIKIMLASYLTYVSFFSFIFRNSKTNLPHNILKSSIFCTSKFSICLKLKPELTSGKLQPPSSWVLAFSVASKSKYIIIKSRFTSCSSKIFWLTDLDTNCKWKYDLTVYMILYEYNF